MYKRVCTIMLAAAFIAGTAAGQMTVKDNANNTLIRVNDEGSVGSITLPDGSAPSDPSGKLYNVSNTLYFNGSSLFGGMTLPWSGTTSSSSTAFTVQKNGGSGKAGYFWINHATNSDAAFQGFTNGLGYAGLFQLSNVENSSEALYVSTPGTGYAIKGYNSGNADGGGYFQLVGVSNTSPALFAQTAGSGTAFTANRIGGTAPIASFQSSSSDVATIAKDGTGTFTAVELPSGTPPATTTAKLYNSGGDLYFDTKNISAGLTLPYAATTSSSGTAFSIIETSADQKTAHFQINNTSNPSAAVTGYTNGTGQAGVFQVSNSSNTSDAILSSTSGTGNVMKLNHNGSSGDIAVFQSDGSDKAVISRDGSADFSGDVSVGYNLMVSDSITVGKGATIGTGNPPIEGVLSASATLDFPETPAGTSSDLTITVTGASDGDPVFLGIPNGSMPYNATYFAWVSTPNTVTVRFNYTAQGSGFFNPPSGTFRVVVFKF